MENNQKPEDSGLCAAYERLWQENEMSGQNAADEEKMIRMAELFKVFGDSTRIRILCALLRSELCVCDLAALLKMTQPAISYQLRIIRQARLIKNRRDGKTIYYRLADDHVRTIIGMAKEHLEE